MVWKNGAKYSGYWLNGKRHGFPFFFFFFFFLFSFFLFFLFFLSPLILLLSRKGEHHFPNDELYVGMWKNGKRSGQGLFPSYFFPLSLPFSYPCPQEGESFWMEGNLWESGQMTERVGRGFILMLMGEMYISFTGMGDWFLSCLDRR